MSDFGSSYIVDPKGQGHIAFTAGNQTFVDGKMYTKAGNCILSTDGSTYVDMGNAIIGSDGKTHLKFGDNPKFIL